MYPREALKTLNKIGDVNHNTFPDNIEMKEAKDLVDKKFRAIYDYAARYKIDAYAKLNDVVQIKTFLYNNKVAIPISIPTADMKVDKTNTLIIPKEYPKSNHMILIVGWNEDGFIIQNSWGEKWGDKGFAILPFDYKINEAWGVSFDDGKEKVKIEKPFLFALRQILQVIIETFRRK